MKVLAAWRLMALTYMISTHSYGLIAAFPDFGYCSHANFKALPEGRRNFWEFNKLKIIYIWQITQFLVCGM